ncbi:HAD family hydrolase [Propionicicella superfundia]|uniref:HAD family hydrolase n=1 Tax=Propionicicella superfundia TaxID=348582 RepID=UPI0003F8BC74|nr:HAD family hydrolase [Propionicicella superfundia]
MSWRPRLVALDIDGTIVDHSGALPAEVSESVARVVAADVPVVLATGRSWHATRPLVEALSLPRGPAISSNGAVQVTFPPVEYGRLKTFDARPVITKVVKNHPDALVAVEVLGSGYRVNSPFPDGDLDGTIEVVPVGELAHQPVTRIIVRDPNSSDDDFIAFARKLGLHGLSYFIGWSAWLDIAPRGVDKSVALAEVAADLGVDRADVLAIGDGRNDIEMLRWAGRGVALGQAPPEVRDVADAVTAPFDEGGTPLELDRWFG